MTRAFNVQYTCQHCGHQTTAETAFGRWMRAESALDSVDGIVRSDADHIILRYKSYTDGRAFQLLMMVEVKEHGAEPDEAQLDVLNFTHHFLCQRGRNMYGARTQPTTKIKSRVTGSPVRVRNYGYHLLQFENTDPLDSAWIKWDRRLITKEILVGIIALERNPFNPSQPIFEMLRDRHRRNETQPQLAIP